MQLIFFKSKNIPMNRWTQIEIFANYLDDTAELQTANMRGSPLTRH